MLQSNALSKYWRRSNRAVHCASPFPSPSPVSCPRADFFSKDAKRRGKERDPSTIFRGSSYGTGRSHAAVCGLRSLGTYLPTALRSRGHVTSSSSLGGAGRGSSMRDLTALVTRDAVVRSRYKHTAITSFPFAPKLRRIYASVGEEEKNWNNACYNLYTNTRARACKHTSRFLKNINFFIAKNMFLKFAYIIIVEIMFKVQY